MKKQINQVKTFHETFEVGIKEGPQFPDEATQQLRNRLLQEELDELKEAVANNDLVEVADALVDIQYLLCGTILEYGMQDKFEALFDEVHRSNMSKLDENGKPVRRADGKVIKSELFSPPALKKILED
ncbi:nucleoside triphosphate pyrophosphohydrolase family protein [Persicobacter diffluens]|uniref:Phosphoribosyl-ATP pyrophosphohydrolase n=1 Tax=Persicobacter diffluens TaxID=981 RepID=A0AAN5AK29_9BACT|nr:hypothetical protein PEDI_00250 [Persicobacter diffluens]